MKAPRAVVGLALGWTALASAQPTAPATPAPQQPLPDTQGPLRSDGLDLTIVFDDRLAEKIVAPVAVIIPPDGRAVRAPLVDDGSLPGDVAGDHVFTGVAHLTRTQSVTLSLRHLVQGEETSIFSRAISLPSASTARVAVRAPADYADAFEIRDPYFYADSTTGAAGTIPSWDVKEQPGVGGQGGAPAGAGQGSGGEATPSGGSPWLWVGVGALLLRAVRPGRARVERWSRGEGAAHLPLWVRRLVRWLWDLPPDVDLPPGFVRPSWVVESPSPWMDKLAVGQVGALPSPGDPATLLARVALSHVRARASRVLVFTSPQRRAVLEAALVEGTRTLEPLERLTRLSGVGLGSGGLTLSLLEGQVEPGLLLVLDGVAASGLDDGLVEDPVGHGLEELRQRLRRWEGARAVLVYDIAEEVRMTRRAWENLFPLGVDTLRALEEGSL